MVSFNFFGKSRKKGADMPNPESMDNMDLPPLPVPKGETGFEVSSFDDDQTSKGIALPELGDEKTTLPAKEAAQYPGLDKDWLDFAKNAGGGTAVAEEKTAEAKPAPVAQSRAAEPRSISSSAKNPIFIEMDTYSGFLGEIAELNVKLHLIDEMVAKTGLLREKEEIELRRWHQGFDDIRKKLLYIDDALFESGR